MFVVQLICVLLAMLSVMFYRISVMAVVYPLTRGAFNLDYAKVKLFITLTAASLNLMIIVILNKVLFQPFQLDLCVMRDLIS